MLIMAVDEADDRVVKLLMSINAESHQGRGDYKSTVVKITKFHGTMDKLMIKLNIIAVSHELLNLYLQLHLQFPNLK